MVLWDVINSTHTHRHQERGKWGTAVVAAILKSEGVLKELNVQFPLKKKKEEKKS